MSEKNKIMNQMDYELLILDIMKFILLVLKSLRSLLL